jgi:predicted phage terminase large subunit-like protein
MSPIKQRIYLDGSWTAREEEAGLYLRSFSKVVPYPNLKATKRVRAYDLASQPVSSQSPNPDWSRGILMSKDADGIYTVEDLVSARDRPHVIEKLILDTARKDKEIFGNVVVAYPCDPGQSGIARAADMKRMLAEIGVECKIIRPQKSKRVRFLPASAIAEAGYLSVVKADWNEEFYKELEEFTGLKRHERDDIVDCVSDAVLCLNQTTVLPTFTLPDLSGPSNTFSVQVPSSGLALPHSGLSLPRH